MIYQSGIYQGFYKGDGIHNGAEGDFVTIGGKKYPFVKIGNQVWVAENLDFLDDSIDFGKSTNSSTKPQANYYQNDRETYGRYGLLYNWLSAKHINDNRSTICPGWHVPSDSDFETLLSFVGSNPQSKLRSEEWGGVDEYGFALLASGQFASNSYSGSGSSTSLWSSTETNETVARRLNSYKNGSGDVIERGYAIKTGQFPIRLIKD